MRHARFATFILLIAGAVGALAVALWIVTAGGDPPHSVMRGFWMIGHSRFEAPVVGGLVFVAAVLGALAWLVRGARTWPLIVALVMAVVACVLVWLLRDWIIAGETPRFRGKSLYVRGANAGAVLGLGYFALVAIAATLALIASRLAPRAAAAPDQSSSAPAT